MSKQDDTLYRQLIEAGLHDARPSDELRRRVLAESIKTLEEARRQIDDANTAASPGQPSVRPVPDVPTDSAGEVHRGAHRFPQHPSRRRTHGRLVAMLQRRSVQGLAAAAAVVFVVLGGLSFWPHSSSNRGKSDAWWLGPPSAWAAEVNTALARAGIKGVTCREQILLAAANGSTHTSSTWTKFYVSKDSYRRDIYDGDVLREYQWYVPDANGLTTFTSVRFDTRTYCTSGPVTGSFGQKDPIERMRFYVNLIDKADRVLSTQSIDGRQCVGFEIRASKYGDNPDTWIDRIWFDVQTRLPVRIEECGRTVTGDSSRTLTWVQEQFDYNPDLPADTFTPQIPEGFTFNDKPDELHKKKIQDSAATQADNTEQK